MRLNKPGNGEMISSFMRPHHDTPAPESPGAITTAQTATPPPSSTHMPSPNAIFFEANIEAIVEAIAQANPTTLTSSQPNTQPSSAPSHTNTTHTHTYTHTSHLAFYLKWLAAIVTGHHPPKRPPHTHTPTPLHRAGRWLWRRMGLMGLCVCVCVGGMGALLGVAMAIEDNYSCVGGEHTTQRSDTVWGVVSRQCRGDRQHAYDDVVAMNPHVEVWGLAQGEVIVLPHSGG